MASHAFLSEERLHFEGKKLFSDGNISTKKV
jgi:hypothetical protein